MSVKHLVLRENKNSGLTLCNTIGDKEDCIVLLIFSIGPSSLNDSLVRLLENPYEDVKYTGCPKCISEYKRIKILDTLDSES